MSTIPRDSTEAPPSPLPAPDPAHRPPVDQDLVVQARPGDLTPSWRLLLGLAWVFGFFAYAAVWNASVQIGIGTWWIGPRAQPTFLLVKLLPFLLCLGMVVCVVSNTSRLIHTSAIATGFAAVGAIPDFSRSIGLGIAELTIAALLGIVTAAALTGRYRLAPVPSSSDAMTADPGAARAGGPPTAPPLAPPSAPPR